MLAVSHPSIPYREIPDWLRLCRGGGDQCWSPAGLNMIIKLCVNQEGSRIRVGTAFLGVYQSTFPISYQPGTLINHKLKQSACKSTGMKGFYKEEGGKERE